MVMPALYCLFKIAFAVLCAITVLGANPPYENLAFSTVPSNLMKWSILQGTRVLKIPCFNATNRAVVMMAISSSRLFDCL